jgi:hypothetical protein
MSTPINRPHNTVSPACLCATMAASAAVNIGANASLGYIAGSVFTIINPIGGAIFGATYALTSVVADGILGAVGCNNNTALKIAKFVISGVLGAVAATFTVAAVGFPITFAAAAMLIGGMTLVSLAIQLIFKCFKCTCCTTTLIGVGVGAAAIAIARNQGRADADIPAQGAAASRDLSDGRISPIIM